MWTSFFLVILFCTGGFVSFAKEASGTCLNGEHWVPSATKQNLSLNLAMEMKVGKTKQGDLVNRLGNPDRVLNVQQDDSGNPIRIWAYFSGGDESVGRVSFSFRAESDIIDSISFDVRNGDSEQNLEYIFSKFNGTTFTENRRKDWDNPHSSPDEIYYEDPKSGLTIVYLKTLKQVTTITWVMPNRSTTSKNELSQRVPFPYCIAELCASRQKQ